MISLPLTLIVTSHARPELLDEAIGSCVDGGVQNIIVTATGITPEMRAKFATFKAIKRDIVIIEHHDSTTNNQAWLAGIEAAQTDWVAILHDDDLILPDYSKLAAQIIASGAPFGVVQAVGHGMCKPYTDDRVGGITGNIHTNAILKVTVKPGALSISPIRGVFNRYDMIAWLTTAEGLPPECFYRPGFVVGNDLLIWIQACDKYPQFYNVAIPGVSYGHWKGSTTVKDLETDKRLFGIYAKTRSWYLERKLWQDRVKTPATPDIIDLAEKQSTSVQPASVISPLEKLRLELITIVLDGMPMITWHLQVLNQLKCQWHWSIVEGAAMNVKCTTWCRPQKPRLSLDGTSEYLNSIADHPNVTIYRKESWNGKVEMMNAPLPSLTSPAVLCQLDCDEAYSVEQLHAMVKLFRDNPAKTHAMVWCVYWFGPSIRMTTRGGYGNNPHQDWKRFWRYKHGNVFKSHEPPGMTGESKGFTHAETEAVGVVMNHAGYMFRKQVEYKEAWYGYKDAAAQWERLQANTQWPVRLNKFLAWVPPNDPATVDLIR